MSDENTPQIPAGLQEGPTPKPALAETLVDEMGVANPVYDISPRIEYLFYKCVKCGKKEFAGAGDTALEVDCICYVVHPDASKKGDKGIHAKMRLLKYSAPRPGVPQPESFTKPVNA
jgi:hypothetical protein